MHSRFRPPAFATLLYLGAPAIALADVITVGPACQYADLQAAINATHGNVNELHVHADYRGKPVRISNKTLHIYGGYPSCNASAPIPFTGNAQDLSWLDGSLDSGAKPVIAIDGQASLDLRNFYISDGHNESHAGGGIRFTSRGAFGHLELHAVEINGNRADYGAGIYFEGGAAVDDLVLYDYSLIRSNTGRFGGGGIHIEGNTHLLANSPQTSVSDNTVELSSNGGSGGGIRLWGHSTADIGSPGLNGDAVILRNHALVGGGMALFDNAQARLYTTASGAPARIEYNEASESGGGVYMHGAVRLCLSGGAINSNTAGDSGGAIYVGSGQVGPVLRAGVDCNDPPGAIDCPLGMPCNSISSNKSEQGWLIDSEENSASIILASFALRGNRAAHLFRSLSNSFDTRLANCEISGNFSGSSALFYQAIGKSLILSSCTVAGNNIDGADVFSNDSAVTLNNTIIWQPGKKTLAHAPESGTSFIDSITQDAASQDPGQYQAFTNVRQIDPAFVDAAAGNFHLRYFSPAVDSAASGEVADLDQRPRPVDIPGIGTGPWDIGAYEVQLPPFPVTFPPVENFDELGQAPTLPNEWREGHNGDNPGWTITGTGTDTGPYAAYVQDKQGFADLITPYVHIGTRMRLSFRHRVSLGGNTTVDNEAVTLFVNVDGSLFTVPQLGGHFTQGVPNACHGQCWTGDHSAYETVTAELPDSLIGKDVRFYWSFGYLGDHPGLAGYWLDSITLEPLADAIFADGFDPS